MTSRYKYILETEVTFEPLYLNQNNVYDCGDLDPILEELLEIEGIVSIEADLNTVLVSVSDDERDLVDILNDIDDTFLSFDKDWCELEQLEEEDLGDYEDLIEVEDPC